MSRIGAAPRDLPSTTASTWSRPRGAPAARLTNSGRLYSQDGQPGAMNAISVDPRRSVRDNARPSTVVAAKSPT
jgi:hypothetical protein